MVYLSPLGHFNSFNEGLIQAKDVIYFLSFTGFMLFKPPWLKQPLEIMMTQEKMKTLLQAASLFLFVLAGVLSYLLFQFPHLWQVTLALAAACFVGGIWMGRAQLKHSLSRRATRYGLNSVMMSVLVFAIVVVVNLIAMNHDTKLDVTKNKKINTLSISPSRW